MKEDISAVANVVSSQDSVEREKEERKIQIKHDAGKNFPFTHIAAIHTHSTASLFSSDSAESLSLRGFRNLAILVLVANNLRLIIENHAKYGLLLTIPTNLFGTSDFLVASILAFAIPLHLLVSFVIEVSAAKESLSAKKDGSVTKRRQWWDIIALAHSANVALCLGISSWAVYTRIYHPVLGFITETHAVIVCLKLASYALTNRDLRDAYLKSEPIPAAYMDGPMYPDLSIHQLLYFWLAPTLIYQPCYPRTARFRKSFFIKRATEFLVLLFALWFIVAQYAVPLCRNSVEAMENLDIRRILERLLKLSTISVICWCAGFFCFFQSGLNACAEAMRFADRTFYLDWWNAGDMESYWRLWNRPVYMFFRRHVYMPLVQRGYTPKQAGIMVFVFSAFLHEILIGIPTHSLMGVAFVAMLLQIPLIMLTQQISKMRGEQATIIGNCIFWITFCLLGHPIGALFYSYTWDVKYRNR